MTLRAAAHSPDAGGLQSGGGHSLLPGAVPPLPRYSRKEKSLGLLCDRLLATYNARPVGSEVRPLCHVPLNVITMPHVSNTDSIRCDQTCLFLDASPAGILLLLRHIWLGCATLAITAAETFVHAQDSCVSRVCSTNIRVLDPAFGISGCTQTMHARMNGAGAAR